jgi:hypothetical protein
LRDDDAICGIMTISETEAQQTTSASEDSLYRRVSGYQGGLSIWEVLGIVTTFRQVTGNPSYWEVGI